MIELKWFKQKKGKTASNIMEVVVSKKVAQKVDENDTQKPTPKKGDAGMMLTSAMTLLSAAAYVFTKKRKED